MTAKTKTIPFAFGSLALELDIPEGNISSIILPSEPEINEDPSFLIKKALENPIKSKRLSEIVNPDSTQGASVPLQGLYLLPNDYASIKYALTHYLQDNICLLTTVDPCNYSFIITFV